MAPSATAPSRACLCAAAPPFQLQRHGLWLHAVPHSLLFLGRPGVGKTTVIREMARVLSDDLHKRVVIVSSLSLLKPDQPSCWFAVCVRSSDEYMQLTRLLHSAAGRLFAASTVCYSLVVHVCWR